MTGVSALYVLTAQEGAALVVMAHCAALTFRRCHPGVPVYLLVDSATHEVINRQWKQVVGAVDRVVSEHTGIVDGAASSRSLKTRMRSLVEGDFVFLDIDTVVLRDLSALWSHGATIAGVYDDNSLGARFSEPLLDRFRRQGWPPPSDPYLNSGVLFWRDNEEGRRLGEAWHQRWLESRSVMGDTDQPPLNRAMVDTGVSVKVLPQDYNQKVRDTPQRLKHPAVLHYTTRSAVECRYTLMNHLMRHLETHGTLDERALDRARDRNDPWVSAGPGIRGNWHTGRYWAALREGILRTARQVLRTS